jgi:hypothetical protein
MADEILQPNTPVKFASRNMRPKFRRLKAGDIFLVEYEVEESVWNSLRTVPEDALIENVLWHHEGDPEPHDKPPPKPKGPYSRYWRQMFRQGFNNFPDLIQVLECTGDQVRLKLHGIFEAESLSAIAPGRFEKWLQEHNLEALVTLSRQAQQKAIQVDSNENHTS